MSGGARPVDATGKRSLPWVVDTIKDHGADKMYRYSITGINYSHDPPRAFSWSVPSIEAERGYDISGARWL